MLQYINHRFHFEGISFQIPDNYFLDSTPGEESENTIHLCAPDESYGVEIRVEEDCDGSEAELASVISDLTPTVVYPIAPLVINGLCGHHATYRNRRTQYYEAWFDIDDGVALSVVVETKGDILDVDAAALIAGIDPRPENE